VVNSPGLVGVMPGAATPVVMLPGITLQRTLATVIRVALTVVANPGGVGTEELPTGVGGKMGGKISQAQAMRVFLEAGRAVFSAGNEASG
jgi:hypothetical protein